MLDSIWDTCWDSCGTELLCVRSTGLTEPHCTILGAERLATHAEILISLAAHKNNTAYGIPRTANFWHEMHNRRGGRLWVSWLYCYFGEPTDYHNCSSSGLTHWALFTEVNVFIVTSENLKKWWKAIAWILPCTPAPSTASTVLGPVCKCLVATTEAAAVLHAVISPPSKTYHKEISLMKIFKSNHVTTNLHPLAAQW